MAKILVTGGTGVLGRAVSKLFLSNQTNFIIGSRHRKAKDSTNDNLASDLNQTWIYMDLTKTEAINKSMNNNIDTILHLASMPQETLNVQPIQVEAVAMELDKIIKGSPLNTTYDIGGRKIYNMDEIVDSLLKVRHEKKLVLKIPIMGKIMKGLAKGYSTCDNISLISNTWEEYLSNKYLK
ncbi:unnamed protein product [Rotaria sordida]|uniref:NADH dehydrogenase [ubiquinone] 1 alpha subcomplex subunit 9, mitochondrial n=1 Tax=Rotaria sordida TaxID=392033 RepID=A0A819F4M8_9BILA|nr:unnamed protein product [Rotaria sordida]CAF4023925.1 unnamed protein product [Rotaria sordida]